MRAPRSWPHLVVSIACVAAFVALLRVVRVANPTTVALGLLVLVLVTATLSRLWVAVVTALVAMFAFNYFFLPPIGTLTIADPQNWIALLAFLVAAVIVSQLSAAAQARAREAVDRRNELARLFDLSRDVLLTTENASTLDALAQHIARRFELDRVAVCLPSPTGWRVHQGAGSDIAVADEQLNLALARAGSTLEFDARQRTYSGHVRHRDAAGKDTLLVPLRFGTRAIGLLAAPTGAFDPGVLDAVAGLAAIAVERSQLLAERKEAELVRQRADLASTLLASLSHDLRTPLTAIRVAVGNLQDPAMSPRGASEASAARAGGARSAHAPLPGLLDMARIDAAAHRARDGWVTAGRHRRCGDRRTCGRAGRHATARRCRRARNVVRVEPRLTSAALSHLLENAVQYAPTDRPIDVRGWVDQRGPAPRR